MTSALPFGAGQISAQLPQPRQSICETDIVKNISFAPRAGFACVPSGAFAFSSAVIRIGRIAACGQTNEHWLHWMQRSGCHSGTSMAMPRFS